MEPASLEDRLAVASNLILQSPPGEVNDVFNDLRPIVGDNNELETGILTALSQYNIEQFTLVELPNTKIPAMICPAARLNKLSNDEKEEERYLDPNSKQTFIFDHLRLTASNVIKYNIEEEEEELNEKIRLELNREMELYVKNHYQDAFCSVFSTNLLSSSSSVKSKLTCSHDDDDDDDDQVQINPTHLNESTDTQTIIESTNDTSDPTVEQSDQSSSNHETEISKNKFQIYIVGNKYNPSNYWTGRWRSNYEIDLNSNQIKGRIQVNVHYYEQGNVQLSTNYEPIIELEPIKENYTSNIKDKIKEILLKIQENENKYQNLINSIYTNLGDDTFKQLRRTLPITKQKINWNNIKSRIVLD